MTWNFETASPEETEELAIRLAKLLQPDDLLTLEGDLGAGKTAFAKGIAKGLGIKRTVNSPTFTILKQYSGDLDLNHLDVYRLEDSEEDIGFAELFEGGAVTIVEWAQFIESYLPEERLEIEIVKLSDQERCFVLRPLGERYETICKELAL